MANRSHKKSQPPVLPTMTSKPGLTHADPVNRKTTQNVATSLSQAVQPPLSTNAPPTQTPPPSFLLGVSADTYGESYREHLLSQYKLFVELADNLSKRRQNANTFFLTINTALVAMLGIVWPQASPELNLTWYSAVAISGSVLCYSWHRLLKSYAGLSKGKFEVIHAIEMHLPLRLFGAEWLVLGQGEDKKKYLQFTHIETKVPWVFFLLYLAMFIAVLSLTYSKYLAAF